MTMAADPSSHLRQLEAEQHEAASQRGLGASIHPHLPHLHGSPQTVTAESIMDQTAQYAGAMKREAFGKDVGQSFDGHELADKNAGLGKGNIVTKVLDDPHSVRVAGGTGKYFRSNDDTLSSDAQRCISQLPNTDMEGSENTAEGTERERSIGSRDGKLLNGFIPSQNGAVPDSDATAQINPFHRLSFPEGTSPPWIAKPLAPGYGHTHSDPSVAPLVHIKRVSRDTVALIPATPANEEMLDHSSTLQPSQSTVPFAIRHDQMQQLELADGHLAVMTQPEEKKHGFFSRFERAFARGGNGSLELEKQWLDGTSQSGPSDPSHSEDFSRQEALDDGSAEVQGNAPPSPPISDRGVGIEYNNVAATGQAVNSSPSNSLRVFQPLGNMRATSPNVEPLSEHGALNGQSSIAGMPPIPKSSDLSIVSTADGASRQRSISGQSYTTEPEPMNSTEENQRIGGVTPNTLLLVPINTGMLDGATSRSSIASTSSSPTTNAVSSADKAVVLAPPILVGTTRAGSIAAIKRGLGKSCNAAGSLQNSAAGSSLIDLDHRDASPVSPQAVSRRMSSDRYSQRATSSTDQNVLGLGIPTNSAMSNAPPITSQLLPSQPPMMPERRNTTGVSSNPKAPARSPLISSQSQLQIPQSPKTSSGFAIGLLGHNKQHMTDVPGLNGSALDPDILAEADRLRTERLNRRQRRRSGSGNEVNLNDEESTSGVQPSTSEETNGDAIPARARSQSKQKERQPPTEQERVLVGNLIGEDHVNFVLMYNMLTGIRIGVSRCQAKIKRPVTNEDYTAKHKYSFDIVGNELTPSARYDFKFKDYAPWVFRELREDYFHLDPADYLLSLTAKYILSELGSPGKSGSFFYFSRDYRFIIKTIHHAEHKYLRSILKDYHHHVKNNPHTLLSRFYGLHRVKLPRGRKIHFVIMNNLFPPHRDIHETYDLKGSTWGREYPEEKAKENPKATLKDLNWIHRGRTFELGPEKRALFSEQLRRDTEFLKMIGVMDYSLLIGIHNMERGNRDNIRENQLSVFHPDVGGLSRRKPSSVKGNSEAAAVRKIVKRSDPKAMSSAIQELPTIDSTDRRHFLFYQDEGGLRATDEANQVMDIIYYLGVIDILTPYNTVKRLEHLWRGTTIDRHMISCVPPQEYGERFLQFLLSFMRGAEPSGRLKTE